MNIVYADNNATTQVAPEVFAAMQPYFRDDYFNPSSMYEPARKTSHAVAAARADIASALGCGDPRQIVFTSCATESNNAAIFGVAAALGAASGDGKPGGGRRRHVVTTAVEHPAVLGVCKEIERRGFDVTFLPVDGDGNLDVAGFVRALRPDTMLVTVMHGNNETGVIFPIEQLSRLTKETDAKIVFHTDATQTVGKLPLRLDGGTEGEGDFRHVDLLSFSGHKLHAPKGIGALFIRRGTPCRPFLIGGHQENGRRAGTENVPYIVGLAQAVRMAVENREKDYDHIRHLRNRLEVAVEQRISHIQVNGKNSPRMPNTLNVSCHYVEGEGMLFQLSEEGICASSGSACTSGSLEPSHVLLALGVPFTAVHGSIRFSFSRYNTEADVDRIIDVFPRTVANLRNLSPYWDTKNNRPRENAEELIRRTH
jgi:cysteine desulfurase